MKMARLIGTTSFKLSALYLGLFLCSFIAIGVIVHLLVAHTLEQQLKANIDAELTRLKTEYDAGGLSELIDELNEITQANPHVDFFYGLVDKDGRLLAGNHGDFSRGQGWQTSLKTMNKSGIGQAAEALAVHVIALPEQLWLGVGHGSNYIQAAGAAITQAFLWGFLLVLLLGTAGGFYLSRAFLKKISRLTQATQTIIAGDLSHRLAVTANHDELDNLAILLNRMLDNIVALIENVQQVTNDIAHDLRTPLSRLKFRLEDLLKPEFSKPDRQAQVALAINEVDSLLATFSALLRISQIESHSRRSGFKTVDLTEIVNAVADALMPVAEEQGKTLTTRLEKTCRLTGDKELLTQVVFNLLENAILHTPENTQITIELATTGPTIEMTVADNGLGISEAYRQKVFQRFYRLERSRTTAGNGLGLSIVAAIVGLHDGTIALADNHPGLKATIKLNARLADKRQEAS